MSISSKDILESPDYYPLQFEGDNLLFVRMSRASYQQSIFTLPNRIVRDGDDIWAVPFAEVMHLIEQADQSLEPPVFLFQIAHCGSTLLSRALDQPNASLVIREPFTLRQFASSPTAENEQDNANRHRVLSALLHLYGRRYEANEPVLIKANVPVNYALNEILAVAPKTKGILLYSGFEDYLLGVLKSQKRRTWAQHATKEMAAKIQALNGFENIDIGSLIPAQAAAVLWLSQLTCYQAVLESRSDSAANALQSLDSNQLYRQPTDTLLAARTHFGINMNSTDIERVVESDIFTRHAKNPEQPFSKEQRLENLSKLRTRYQDRIDYVLAWCDKSGFDVSATVKGNLLNSRVI